MKKQVWAYLHTHWDREWYRNKEEFNLRLLEVFDIILDELKHNRAPFFYFDGQVIALLDYLKYRQEKKEEITSLIKNKKLAIGPYFVSADSYLLSFMSMLNNLKLGLNLSRDFGQKEYIGYMSDIFGISNSAFEVLKIFNIDKALIWRGVNPKKIDNNCDFIKNGIKTTWLAQGYFNDFFHQDKINIEGIKSYLGKISKYSKSALLLPIGADHLGGLKDANKKIAYVNSVLDDYEIILTSPFEYFKKVKHENETKEDEFLDNSNTYVLKGVYSTRISQKIKNNQIQNDLSRIVEPLNFYLKDKYEKNIEETYKTLIKNHAHDGIYGCSLDSVAKTVDSRFLKCECMIEAIKKRLVGNFKTKNKIKGQIKDKIGLFNLSNGEINKIEITLPYVLKNAQVISKTRGFRDELLYDIYKIPVTENIEELYTQIIETSKAKSFEFNTVKIKKPNKKTVLTNKSIENDYIKLEVKNKKIFIKNKKTNDEFELKLTDVKDCGDSYNFSPKGERKVLELLSSKIEYEGIIQSALKLSFKDIELLAIVDNKSDFVKFKSKINNKTKNRKIQLEIITKDKITLTTASDAIGIIKRKVNPDYKIEDYIPAKRPVELMDNSYPMQNFVCTNKAIVLTKGLHEYEIYKNKLRICLLRATGTISNPKNPSRSIPAGPDLKTPNAQMQGICEAEFILSFGDYKKAFKILDNLFKNYIPIEGEFLKEISFKLGETKDNSYFYGIYKNKKIGYDFKENKILLI